MASARRIFLSSTYKDLVPYRIAVEGLLRAHGAIASGMEYFGAQSQTSMETCLEEVSRSDMVIALVGSRYGSTDGSGISYTQREIERARADSLPVLVFVQSNPSHVSQSEATRRRKFVRWLEQHYTVAHFENEGTLLTELSAALNRVKQKSQKLNETSAWTEILHRAHLAANFDCLTVTANNVDYLYPVDRVAADYETEIKEPHVCPGGSGANTAAGLGRLGMKVAVAGAVGSDDLGGKLRDAFDSDNVTPLLVPSGDERNQPTGKTIVFADKRGRRSIFVDPGVNNHFAVASKAGSYLDQLRSAMRSTRIVHYSSFTLAPERRLQESLLEHLPETALLSLTPGALYCKLGIDRMWPLLSRANIVFLYEQQLDSLLGDGKTTSSDPTRALDEKIERLYRWKRENGYQEPLAVVIKNAPTVESTVPHQLRGAVGRDRCESSQPTQALAGGPIDIRDSTGAGDASAAGLLWAILNGKPLDDAIDTAYVLARSASQQYGARDGLLTHTQLKRRWEAWMG